MGGKKKLSLKQMERTQDKKDDQDKEKGKKKEKPATSKEKKALSVVPPDPRSEKTVSEIKKMQVLTPFIVATRFNIRISAAKDFLDQLEANGAIQFVSGNHNIKIYRAG